MLFRSWYRSVPGCLASLCNAAVRGTIAGCLWLGASSSIPLPCAAQENSAPPNERFGVIERVDPRMDELIATDAKLESLASGFGWSEGPLWIKDDAGGYLIFSDVPRNTVLKWKEGEGISTFLKPSGFTGLESNGQGGGSNGLILDPEGRIVFCEHGDRRMSVLTSGGGKLTLADRYQGKRFNSPNDAVYDSQGNLYFTDPAYGLPKRFDDPLRELDYCGVFRLSKEGEVTLLTKEFTRPNGLAFSPDEKTLYITQSDTEAALCKAFAVGNDGSLSEGRVFFDFTPWVKAGKRGLPDGLRVDAQGNVFSTGPGGIHVIAPDGTHLGSIDTGLGTANCAWGDDGSVLYITAHTHLCRLPTKTKGAGW